MVNPFKSEKADSKSVKSAASKEYRELESKIDQLSIVRQWSGIGLAFYSFVQLVLLTLDWQRFLADTASIVFLVFLAFSFGFVDQQIKHLKALQNSLVMKRIDP